MSHPRRPKSSIKQTWKPQTSHNLSCVQILHHNGSKDSNDITSLLGNLQSVRLWFCEQVHHFTTHFIHFSASKNISCLCYDYFFPSKHKLHDVTSCLEDSVYNGTDLDVYALLLKVHHFLRTRNYWQHYTHYLSITHPIFTMPM